MTLDLKSLDFISHQMTTKEREELVKISAEGDLSLEASSHVADYHLASVCTV